MTQIKSEKAKAHIIRMAFYVDKEAMLPRVITYDNCSTAVELAEQDARERAVRAFRMACKWYDDGRDCCWGMPANPQRKCDRSHCSNLDTFLKHLDNEK